MQQFMRNILTVTGASGSGKDSIVDALLVHYGVKSPKDCTNIAKDFSKDRKRTDIRELISHTTRPMRAGEQEGVDYYYITPNEFSKLHKIESTEYAGNSYCLSQEELEKIVDGGWGLVVVDQHGVKCIRDFVANHPTEYSLTSIFLSIDADVSKSRMEYRGDSQESIKKRLTQQEERHEYYPTDTSMFSKIFNNYMYDDAVGIIEHLIHIIN